MIVEGVDGLAEDGDGELLLDLEKKEFLLDFDGVNILDLDGDGDVELGSVSSAVKPTDESLFDLKEGIVVEDTGR